MARIDAVGAVVVRADGRVLLVRRGRAPAKGEWSLPGGKIEPGETPAQACAREVREETALAVRVVESLAVVALDRDGFSYAIHEHLCVPHDDAAEIRAGDDADDVRWVPVPEIAGLGVSTGARAIIDIALARRNAHA
jgi:acetyl-CoA carboxylase carboxyl transferase subunit beta